VIALAILLSAGCDQKSSGLSNSVDAPGLGLEPAAQMCGDAGLVVPTSSEDRAHVVINEVFAGSLTDDDEDWIEILNAGGKGVLIGGWRIEDRFTSGMVKPSPEQFVFPAATFICPGALLVVTRDRSCDDAPMTFDFGVGSTDRIILMDSKEREVDDVRWEELPDGLAFARVADGVFERIESTQGQPNRGGDCPCCSECIVLGTCLEQEGSCVATTDLKCKTSLACRQLGLCKRVADRCEAATAEDCKLSSVCLEKGRCALGDGACVLGNDTDCSHSTLCDHEGRCFADRGRGTCVAGSEDDCRKSEDCVKTEADATGELVVTRKNRCTLDLDVASDEIPRCVATSCVDATVCKDDRNCCALVDGKCVAP